MSAINGNTFCAGEQRAWWPAVVVVSIRYCRGRGVCHTYPITAGNTQGLTT